MGLGSLVSISRIFLFSALLTVLPAFTFALVDVNTAYGGVLEGLFSASFSPPLESPVIDRQFQKTCMT